MLEGHLPGKESWVLCFPGYTRYDGPAAVQGFTAYETLIGDLFSFHTYNAPVGVGLITHFTDGETEAWRSHTHP